jgi:cyclic pyranopterin phosphate synthase
VAELSHLDDAGSVRMVDVGAKSESRRRAVAEAWLVADPTVLAMVRGSTSPKGNVLETARLAGIMAAKRTHELIPLCHQLALDHVAVRFECHADRIRIETEASARGVTGVEMEAFTAAAVAGLTLVDMLKAASRTLRLDGLRLLAKEGGRSGSYRADGNAR